MIQDRYPIKTSSQNQVFEFTSIGPVGKVVKVVRYTLIDNGLYNLGFGDKDPFTEEIDDTVITNNKDSKKVLASVATTLYAFTDTNPDAQVFATGSTPARTRLYQIGITNNLAAIEKDFYIYGLKDGYWQPFKPNVSYAGFLVQLKPKV